MFLFGDLVHLFSPFVRLNHSQPNLGVLHLEAASQRLIHKGKATCNVNPPLPRAFLFIPKGLLELVLPSQVADQKVQLHSFMTRERKHSPRRQGTCGWALVSKSCLSI